MLFLNKRTLIHFDKKATESKMENPTHFYKVFILGHIRLIYLGHIRHIYFRSYNLILRHTSLVFRRYSVYLHEELLLL